MAIGKEGKHPGDKKPENVNIFFAGFVLPHSVGGGGSLSLPSVYRSRVPPPVLALKLYLITRTPSSS